MTRLFFGVRCRMLCIGTSGPTWSGNEYRQVGDFELPRRRLNPLGEPCDCSYFQAKSVTSNEEDLDNVFEVHNRKYDTTSLSRLCYSNAAFQKS